MTREEILDMPAGKKMDALIFQYVFAHAAFIENIPTKHYSTDIAAAWEVVEKLSNSLDELVLDVDGDWRCYFGEFVATDKSAPLAICRAALLAVSVKEKSS